MPRTTRATRAIRAIVATFAVALLLRTACSGGGTAGLSVISTSTTETADGTVIDVTVGDPSASSADSRVTVPLGEEVTILVTSPAADVIHVHGYDHREDVVAGEQASLTFTADIPGVFEVELEDSGVKLVELEVR